MQTIMLILALLGIFFTLKSARMFSNAKITVNLLFWGVILVAGFRHFPGEIFVIIPLFILMMALRPSRKESGRLRNRHELKKLYKKVKKLQRDYDPEDDEELEEPISDDIIKSLAAPGLFLSPFDNECLTKIGGLPRGFTGLKWPFRNEKPMSFLCQIDLSDIPDNFPSTDLPMKGLLFFFLDCSESSLCSIPDAFGNWAVLYSDRVPESHSSTSAPSGLAPEEIFPEKKCHLENKATYPSADHETVEALQLTEEQLEQYDEFYEERFTGHPVHHMLGHPQPIQNSDMESDCFSMLGKALARRGVQLPENREDEKWVLLLQLDSDDDASMMWVDAGMLYFWIRESDLKERNFSNVWMILQCC